MQDGLAIVRGRSVEGCGRFEPTVLTPNDGQAPLRLPVWPARFCVAVGLVADQDAAEVFAG
jgi:hypothetical protein